jgi:hypothetical protein
MLQQALNNLEALGLDDGPATAQDTELVYLHHQAHAAKLEDDVSYTLAVTNKITPTMSVAEQIDVHLAYWNKRMGVADVRQLPQYDPMPKFDKVYRPVGANGYEAEEGGWGHFTRFDMTKADIDKAMPGWGLSHRTKAGAEGFLKLILDSNGQMMNTEERVRNGVYLQGDGDSSSRDMGTGGASYLFTRIQRPAHFGRHDYGGRPHFVFSTDLLLRTDNIAYDSDKFGKSDPVNKRQRGVTTDDWKRHESSSGNEVVIKNGFAVLEYVIQIRAGSNAERGRIISLLKSRGISEIRGKPVEDIVVVD